MSAESTVLTRGLKHLLETTNAGAFVQMSAAWAGKDPQQPRGWRYTLVHLNGELVNAESAEEAVSKFLAVCAAARLMGWKPKPTSQFAELSDEMKTAWAKTFADEMRRSSFINKFMNRP